MTSRIAHLVPASLILLAACTGDPIGTGARSGDPSAAALNRRDDSQVTPSLVRLGTPTVLELSVFELWGATTTDCSGAVVLRSSGATPVTNDFVSHPTVRLLAHTTVTYRCIILVMEDVIDFRSAVTIGPCAGGVPLQHDIYRAPDTDFLDMSLTPIIAHGSNLTPVVDRVPILFAADPAATAARGFSVNQILPLVNTAVVPGPLRLRINPTNAMVDEGGICSISPTSAVFF
ncbi:MAG: hypothetical protein ABI877_23480 [Gemmatimonadaceae bacterium]